MPKRSQNPNIKPISSRYYLLQPADNGLILDLGPPNQHGQVGTFTIQFSPDLLCDFSATVMGVLFGNASDDAALPFMPIPYRRITLANVASDYTMVTAAVAGASIIQVPANSIAVGLFVAITQGTCAICSWDMNGPSAV